MVSKLNVFSCKVCNKKLNDIITARHTLNARTSAQDKQLPTSNSKLQRSYLFLMVTNSVFKFSIINSLLLLKTGTVGTTCTDAIEDKSLGSSEYTVQVQCALYQNNQGYIVEDVNVTVFRF